MTREEREEFNQDEFFMRQYLKLDPQRVYEEKDPEDEATLNRAIDLLHHKRQGQDHVTRVLTTHIDYSALPMDMRHMARSEREFAIRKEGKERFEQKKQAMERLKLR
ncbi:MAG: hypothetical protein Q9181_006326, partial [Wetmoreana brouardii]